MRTVGKVKRWLSARRQEMAFPFRDYQRRNGCVFIHVPKVAGTSILEALGKRGGARDHLPWYVYYTASPDYFARAYKFSFVRNPWSRAWSAYRYLSAGGNGAGDEDIREQIDRFRDFDDFVVNGLGDGAFRNHLLFLPQSEFVADGTGRLRVDFLGRYEALESDFGVVAKRLGLVTTVPSQNRSRGEGADYRRAYQTDAAVEVVGHLYRQDVRLFGYHFS